MMAPADGQSSSHSSVSRSAASLAAVPGDGQLAAPAAGQRKPPAAGQLAVPTTGQLAVSADNQPAAPATGHLDVPSTGKLAVPAGEQDLKQQITDEQDSHPLEGRARGNMVSFFS